MNALEYANKASKLFAIPHTAMKIKELEASSHGDLKQICKIVASDPGLAAHVLKLANSAIYRFSRKIEDLDKAIQVIGLNSVYEFALAFSVTDSLNREHEKYINIDKYWFQSLACALMAKRLAQLVKEKDVSRLFVAGLFHNIGQLAVLRVNPTLARDCSRLSEKSLPKKVQSNLLGFSFAEISAALLQRWMLPDSVVSTVAMQHAEGIASLTIEVQIMQLAYASAIYLTYPELYELQQVVPDYLREALQIDSRSFEEALEDSEQQASATVSVFTNH